jgi:hypothetical protein
MYMPSKKNPLAIKKKDTEDLLTVIVPSQVSAEVSVVYLPVPLKSPNKKIHSRQAMPVLKKGIEIPDEAPTDSTKIEK